MRYGNVVKWLVVGAVLLSAGVAYAYNENDARSDEELCAAEGGTWEESPEGAEGGYSCTYENGNGWACDPSVNPEDGNFDNSGDNGSGTDCFDWSVGRGGEQEVPWDLGDLGKEQSRRRPALDLDRWAGIPGLDVSGGGGRDVAPVDPRPEPEPQPDPQPEPDPQPDPDPQPPPQPDPQPEPSTEGGEGSGHESHGHPRSPEFHGERLPSQDEPEG